MTDPVKRSEEKLAGITPEGSKMTVTFCAVCEYLISSSDPNCPLCGWLTNSTPVVFGVDQVREIIGNIKHWEYQQHEGAMDLAMKVVKEREAEVKALREEREQRENYMQAYHDASAELTSLQGQVGCTCSHPHEDMGEVCKLKTELAKANNGLVHSQEENKKHRKNIEYILANTPGAVRVCEGGGEEEVAASLAVTWSKLTAEITSLRGVVEKVRTVVDAAKAADATGSSYEEGQRDLARDIHDLLPEKVTTNGKGATS